MIPTWAERCEKFEYGKIVTNLMIQEKMQEEIDALRKELQRLSNIGQEIECELTDDEIMEICDALGRDITKWRNFQIEFARVVIKKSREK
jgi:hypothetical protein